MERRKLSTGYKYAKEKYLSRYTAKANADMRLFAACSMQPQKSHERAVW